MSFPFTKPVRSAALHAPLILSSRFRLVLESENLNQVPAGIGGIRRNRDTDEAPPRAGQSGTWSPSRVARCGFPR